MLSMHLVIAIFVLAICVVIQRRLKHNRNIPGPLIGSITSYYRVWLLIRGVAPTEYASLHRKYGKVVKTGPNHVSIADVQCIPIVYDLKHKFIKGPFYDVFRPLYRGIPMDTVFTTSDPALNKKLKYALLTDMLRRPQLSVEEIGQSVAFFNHQMGTMQEQAINFSDWAFYWAFDLTHVLVFGGYFGFMESKSDFNGFVHSFKTIIRPAAVLGQVPQWCRSTLANNTFMTFLRRFPSFPDPIKMLLDEIEKKIHEHGSKPHFCDSSLLCQVLSNRNVKSDPTLYAEAVNILFEAYLAAAGEVAVSLATTIYCLLLNERVYRKLKIVIHEDDENAVPYLNAVIKEALRVHTSNSPPMERVVPAGGLKVNDYHIPEGTVVGIPQYVVHRDRNIYGADAEDFRPERWLEADDTSLKNMEQTFMTFGKGCRGCVGRELAMLEMRTFISEVLKRFDISWAYEDVRPKTKNYWMMEYFNFFIYFKEHNTELHSQCRVPM